MQTSGGNLRSALFHESTLPKAVNGHAIFFDVFRLRCLTPPWCCPCVSDSRDVTHVTPPKRPRARAPRVALARASRVAAVWGAACIACDSALCGMRMSTNFCAGTRRCTECVEGTMHPHPIAPRSIFVFTILSEASYPKAAAYVLQTRSYNDAMIASAARMPSTAALMMPPA